MSKFLSLLIQQSEDYRNQSELEYIAAENALVQLIGLHSRHTFGSTQSYIKSFSESYGVNGRFDAEYYQPKYDQLFETLDKLQCKPLGGENGLVARVVMYMH